MGAMLKPTVETSAKILIVEDDRSTRSLLRLAMAEEGYQVIDAPDGEQGVAEYQYSQPDMVLLDAVMPGMDGFTCCQRLRELPGGEQIPILILTVLDDQRSVDQAFTAGATDYITKPIHWPVLAQRVKRLLAAQQAMAVAQQTKQNLYEQQAWTQLIRNSLQQFAAAPDLWGPLQETVTAIYQIWGVEQVALWQRHTHRLATAGRQIREINTTTHSSNPAGLQLTLLDLGNDSPWSAQLQAGEPVQLDRQISVSLPQSPVLAHLEALGLWSLWVVPILVCSHLWGYVYVGDTRPFEAVDQTALTYLKDWVTLLGIVIERQQLRDQRDLSQALGNDKTFCALGT